MSGSSSGRPHRHLKGGVGPRDPRPHAPAAILKPPSATPIGEAPAAMATLSAAPIECGVAVGVSLEGLEEGLIQAVGSGTVSVLGVVGEDAPRAILALGGIWIGDGAAMYLYVRGSGAQRRLVLAAADGAGVSWVWAVAPSIVASGGVQSLRALLLAAATAPRPLQPLFVAPDRLRVVTAVFSYNLPANLSALPSVSAALPFSQPVSGHQWIADASSVLAHVRTAKAELRKITASVTQ